MPITFKENILTKDLATGAGIFAFKDFIPTEDATLLQIGYAFEQETKLRVLQS